MVENRHFLNSKQHKSNAGKGHFKMVFPLSCFWKARSTAFCNIMAQKKPPKGSKRALYGSIFIKFGVIKICLKSFFRAKQVILKIFQPKNSYMRQSFNQKALMVCSPRVNPSISFLKKPSRLYTFYSSTVWKTRFMRGKLQNRQNPLYKRLFGLFRSHFWPNLQLQGVEKSLYRWKTKLVSRETF